MKLLQVFLVATLGAHGFVMGSLPEYSHFIVALPKKWVMKVNIERDEKRPAGKGSVLKDVAWVEQDNMDLKRKETTLNFQSCCV